MATVNFDFAGLAAVYASRLNSQGLLSGYANVSVAGASSDARRLKAAQTVPNPIPQPTKKNIRGDNTRQRTYIFQNEQDATGSFEFGQSDLQFEADMVSQLIWTLGEWKLGLRGQSNPIFRNMSLIAHSDATNDDTGLPGFMNVWYPNAILFPIGQDNQTYQGEGKFSYAATVNPFAEVPLGLDLTAEKFGATNGLSISWFSDYPCMLFAAIGEGGTTDDFVVAGTPVTAAKTKAFVTASGTTTEATVSSVNAGTKTITLSAAPASGSVVTFLYESSLFYE